MTAACRMDIQLLNEPVEVQPLDMPESCGAEAIFLGRTRGEEHRDHGALVRLDYEAHASLAIASMQELADEAAERFSCEAIRLHHATGPVAIGEASVLVQVAAGHRAEAIEASRFLIDELKKRVPIWKREVWQDGTTWAEGAVVSDAADS